MYLFINLLSAVFMLFVLFITSVFISNDCSFAQLFICQRCAGVERGPGLCLVGGAFELHRGFLPSAPFWLLSETRRVIGLQAPLSEPIRGASGGGEDGE